MGPASVYGASKEGGEQAVRTLNRRHVILRTAWVVSATGSNFIKTMLRLAETRDTVSVVDDQLGCPTSARDISAVLKVVADRLLASEPSPLGTYHLVNQGEATWHALACHVFAQATSKGLSVPTVVPIPTTQYPTPARRPANSRLDTTKLVAEFGVTLRPWQTAVTEVVDELLTLA